MRYWMFGIALAALSAAGATAQDSAWGFFGSPGAGHREPACSRRTGRSC